jgi:hypothetical protein
METDVYVLAFIGVHLDSGARLAQEIDPRILILALINQLNFLNICSFHLYAKVHGTNMPCTSGGDLLHFEVDEYLRNLR